MKKKVLIDDPSDKTFRPSSHDVEWECWRIAGHMDRRRIDGPKGATAQTAHFARKIAAVKFDGCDPMHVEVREKVREKQKGKSNGKKEER